MSKVEFNGIENKKKSAILHPAIFTLFERRTAMDNPVSKRQLFCIGDNK